MKHHAEKSEARDVACQSRGEKRKRGIFNAKHFAKYNAKYNKSSNLYYCDTLSIRGAVIRPNLSLQEAHQTAKDAEETVERHAAILPERVLKENNTNLFFSSINNGDELLLLKRENYYTLANVGDLHVIRIARFQCNCSSACHRDEERICADRDYPVNRTLSATVVPMLQYCCRLETPESR